MFNVRLAGNHLCGKKAVRLAIAGDAFYGVLFCAVLFHRRCLG